MNNKIYRAIIITGILFTITCIHQSSPVATVNKSVCLTITTTDSVAPIPPDTIRDTFSGSNAVLYAHQHIRTDSIYNLGYLPFEY